MTSIAVPAVRPLVIGGLRLETPVELAPMAGITNEAFRRLCREYGDGLYVCEMITSRALVERNPATMRLIRHHPSEHVRSIQLYGVDPETVAQAVRILVDEDRADHVDLNFGCPVPKVTRKGGGAALPWKRDLFAGILGAAVDAAQGRIPVTVKMRKGIDADHLTYLDAGRIAEDAGVSAIALHGRTAAEHYSGYADWDAIAALKAHVTSIPVLGNGDIWSGEDAVRMLAHTRCDGVVVGRGCLGRPWLFADLEAALRGSPERVHPSLAEIGAALVRHAELLVEFFGDEGRACRDIRKHVAWYFKGYPVGGALRREFALVDSVDELRALLARLPDAPYDPEGVEGPRGRAGTPKQPHLPDRWLESRTLSASQRGVVHAAELDVSGG